MITEMVEEKKEKKFVRIDKKIKNKDLVRLETKITKKKL